MNCVIFNINLAHTCAKNLNNVVIIGHRIGELARECFALIVITGNEQIVNKRRASESDVFLQLEFAKLTWLSINYHQNENPI